MGDMSERLLDAEVAEKVVGWTNITSCTAAGVTQVQGMPPGNVTPGAFVPKYTTDVAADYEVLKHVQSTWKGTPKMLAFHWQLHNQKGWVQYAIGDYSRAALSVLRGGGR